MFGQKKQGQNLFWQHLYGRSKAVLGRFLDGFNKHDLMTLSAALSFYTALSLAPLLLLIIAVIGLMGPGASQGFLAEINEVMGNDAAQAVSMIVQNAAHKPHLGSFAGIVGVLTLLFSASGVFAQLQSSLNVIWDSELKRPSGGIRSYLLKRLFSMGMVLALAFLALVSLAASTVLSAILPANEGLWTSLNVAISLLVFTYLFALLFKYLPDAPVSWRHVLIGGFITSGLFSIGKSVIGIYLGRSAIGSAYGAAGSLIVLLAWVYYSSIIVFMGAEFTKAAFAVEKDPEKLAASGQGLPGASAKETQANKSRQSNNSPQLA